MRLTTLILQKYLLAFALSFGDIIHCKRGIEKDIFEGHTTLWGHTTFSSGHKRQKSDQDQYSQWGVNGTKLAIFSMGTLHTLDEK